MTNIEVITRVRLFLEGNVKEDLDGKLSARGEDSASLYYVGKSVQGPSEEIQVMKDDGEIFTRPTGSKKWFTTDIFCDCFRTCSHCKKLMIEGYVIEDGEDYYCSDEHLETKYTRKQFLEMFDDGKGDSYWHEW
ncbi:hypothetical protein C7437_1011043 [Psychrobacillus insolitus]|uniref:Uncharacterized protein n=1 Tax=Psychrobacillus insolitus TaxID=1461 RepID=A0A2W7MVT5_9BACI|nr:hypothetical protein [Psychrobacillus insolitus]PZX07921.1 hypothetical protein C7437_1011043 [Psychrobacillus insolitus]